MESYDAIVIGGGHAGCEAALALARTGRSTLCLTLSLDAIAHMACNPAIGGTSKGHLVREIDALGGQMGRTIDATFIQSRMINTRKGPAVHSLRAQADKARYSAFMRRVLLETPNLTLLQGEAKEILVNPDGTVGGIVTTHGASYSARAVVVATGVYLQSRILAGEFREETGPGGLMRSSHLTASIRDLGFSIMRFKTGTPPRINKHTVEVERMELQPGDEPVVPFSFLTDPQSVQIPQVPCYLTYTNRETHDILHSNLDRSPLYSGIIQGMGARYCPSIEDKIVRFADKERHQLFIEPEGLDNDELYVQGFSTSMPFDVQEAALHTVPGLERAAITRYGYAIEYDCIDATALTGALMAKGIPGLFFAGQVCGSSGYEEAAAQGLMAGLNASLYLREREPLILTRDQGYIGVLIDDLTTLGTPEPYRMMTSRAEYRLILRQDNADLRLTRLGYEAGLAGEERYRAVERKERDLARGLAYLEQRRLTAAETERVGEALGAPIQPGATLWSILARNDAAFDTVTPYLAESFSPGVARQMEIQVKYQGYIQRQERDIQAFLRMEQAVLPDDLDYQTISSLRIEAREKLNRVRPRNLGQAGRISGVSPSDISVLMVYLKHRAAGSGGRKEEP